MLLLSCCIFFFFFLYTNTRTPHVAREREALRATTLVQPGDRDEWEARSRCYPPPKKALGRFRNTKLRLLPGESCTGRARSCRDRKAPQYPCNFEDKLMGLCFSVLAVGSTSAKPDFRRARSGLARLLLRAAPADQRCVNRYLWLEGKRDTGARTSDVTASPTFPLLFKQTGEGKERAGLTQSRGSTDNYPALTTLRTPSLLTKLFVLFLSPVGGGGEKKKKKSLKATSEKQNWANTGGEISTTGRQK